MLFRSVKMAYSAHEKSVEQLGFEDTISIEDGVREMADWAMDMGPQEWKWSDLELVNDKVPTIWRDKKV